MSKSPEFYQPKNLKRAEKWREYYNPLRALNIQIIVARLQSQQLGIVSDIQWLYRFTEERYPVLSALIERRTSAIKKLTINFKTTPEDELPTGFTIKDAEAQALELRTAYDRLDNLRAAIEFIALASFRGFSHLEKHFDDDGNVTHLEPVPQWNWARDGLFGDWFYNEGAFPVYGPGPGLVQIDDELLPNFIIREVERPIDVIALFAFIRDLMAQKDWDGFVETYGLPPLFIELPPNMPADQQAQYQAMAEAVIGDARGTLPNGAKVLTVDAGGRGKNPFLEYKDYQAALVVLKGTGGKLTMMTEAGSGTLAGGAHKDSFDDIAEGEAQIISEIFNTQFDRPALEKKFPNQPILAYFELVAKEQVDTSAIVKDIVSLANSGLAVPPDQVQELTNYRVELRDPVSKVAARADAGDASIKPAPDVANRRRARVLVNRIEDTHAIEALIESISQIIDEGRSKAYLPILNRCQQLLDTPDADYPAACKKLVKDLPGLLKAAKASDADVKAWKSGITSMLMNGLATLTPKSTKKGAK